MKVYHSIPTVAYLTSILETEYSIEIDKIHLYREMGGSIYYLSTRDSARFVLKIYKAYHTEEALQAAEVMEYLDKTGFAVAPIVRTRDGRLLVSVAMPGCECLAAMFPFIEGNHPDVMSNIDVIGRSMAELHEIMEGYPRALRSCSRQTHIEDFIAFMAEYFSSRSAEIQELEDWGNLLWERAEALPFGFCHNDYHNHNMVMQDQRVVLFDFDTASLGHPMFDVASICDQTDFWKVTADDVDSTLRCLDKLNSVYTKVRSLSDEELASVFDCIAIRHYRLHGVRDRAPIRGVSHMTQQWFDNLMKWQRDFRELTDRVI